MHCLTKKCGCLVSKCHTLFWYCHFSERIMPFFQKIRLFEDNISITRKGSSANVVLGQRMIKWQSRSYMWTQLNWCIMFCLCVCSLHCSRSVLLKQSEWRGGVDVCTDSSIMLNSAAWRPWKSSRSTFINIQTCRITWAVLLLDHLILRLCLWCQEYHNNQKQHESLRSFQI